MRELNLAICRALGLDPMNVAGIVISFSPDDWPQVTVCSRLSNDQGELIDVLSDYELVPKEANTLRP